MNPEPQPVLPEGRRQIRRRRRPIEREQHFIDWSPYKSIWHLPDHWIAEALGYTDGGIRVARHREAPETLKDAPTDPKVWLQIAYPLVEGHRWTEDEILNLLIKVEELEVRNAAANQSIEDMKKVLAEVGLEIPPAPKPEPKTWGFLRWLVGGGLAAASIVALISFLAGGAK